MTFEQTLIISIITAVTTGILSILGVVLTLRQNNKQLRLQMKLQQEEKLQHIVENRPELEIVGYSKKWLDLGARVEPNDSIIECVYSPQVGENPSNKRFVIIEYTLENIGNEMIEYVDFIPLQRGAYFYDVKKSTSGELYEISALHDKAEKCITYYGDKFRSHEKFKIRIWFCEDREPINFPTVSACIAYKSFNKKFWRQNFHIPSKVLEESVLITEKDYNELTTRIE